MRTNIYTYVAVAFAAITLVVAGSPTTISAQKSAPVAIDKDDVGGVVSSAKGPEAGVWVIAETRDLPTRFIRIVVTDDRGRYVVPDLPAATYDVWVRGYGLVDSPKVRTTPGKHLDLTAVIAPNARTAAQYYPAGYWLSLLRVPDAKEFPGTGSTGNGIAPTMRTQAEWIGAVTSVGCTQCHQMGNKATREVPASLGKFPSTAAAWERRVKSGQGGGTMFTALSAFGRNRVLKMFADWTDRVTAGEFPASPPPRPQGIERNAVITLWDWTEPKAYIHDSVATDRRNPSVNAFGPIYGATEDSTEYIAVLDPVRHAAGKIPVAPRDPRTPRTRLAGKVFEPSPYWGDEEIWTSRATVHNLMLDEKGLVWFTAAVRPFENPRFCKAGSSHPSARLSPLDRSERHLAVYDPKTKQTRQISTCFGTHHLMFAEDANNTLWTSGGTSVVGWLNTKMYLETNDEEKSQGWTALVMDTNGNGKRDPNPVAPVSSSREGASDATIPGEGRTDFVVDPSKDTIFPQGFYAVAPAPDGSIWGTSIRPFPGAVIRISPGAHPPETTLAEVYQPPLRPDGNPVEGFSLRGGDVDRNGVFWMAMASGHMASFDRRKCKGPLNGPKATGQQCPEGWSFYKQPLPPLAGAPANTSAEGAYFAWVDQFSTLGLGNNVPMAPGNGAEAMLVLKDGKWVVLRVPYPMGFYAKLVDGRIDNPKTGWKGRGLWSSIGTRTPFHMETGRGTTSQVIQFQLRPDPLEK